MPIVGTREDSAAAARGYQKDPLHAMAEQFLSLAKSAVSETGLSVYQNPQAFFAKNSTNEEMKRFFIKESYDPKDPKFAGDPAAIAEHEQMMAELYTNDRKAINEAVALNSFNPVIGITFPMHKNLLMNAVFDQAMAKSVAVSPKFTLTMETRTLVTPDGEEIDMFLEQWKIKDAVKNSIPQQDIVIAVPETETVDILGTYFSLGSSANLSMKSAITGVLVDSYVKKGEKYWDASQGTHGAEVVVATDADAGIKPVIMPVGSLEFSPSYGEFDRSIMAPFNVVAKTDANGNTKTISGIVTGFMKKNKFMLAILKTTDVKAVRLNAVVDVSSAAFKTCKTKWSAKTNFYEIPEAPHITTTFAPEEVKDVQALYNVNQLTKLMAQIKLAMLHYKDDMIHEELDKSFVGLDNSQRISGAFDFIPPQGSYMASHVSWRQETFMDYLDMQVTNLLQVLNDENMTVTVFGRPELIRKLTPKEYTYSTPSNIGPVKLDFTKTVVTSDQRVYQFISTQKMRNNNNLIIILQPRNTQRIIYQVVDYQLYISNEIRDTENYQLPAITCFERWKFLQYQPVQGRIQIMNPTGLREDIQNPDPIGVNAANDYTANGITYRSAVNGAK